MVLRILRLFFLPFLLLSCSVEELKFTGNLAEPLFLSDSSNLEKFLSTSDIPAESALICGKDGTAVYVLRRSFSEIELIREKSCWNSVAVDLPEVCNIKDIANISLFVRNPEHQLFILNNTEQQEILTPFEAELSQYEFLGKSKKNGHTARKYLFVNTFSCETNQDSILAIKRDGTEKWLFPGSNGILENIKLKDNYFSLHNKPLVTIWSNAPDTDVYDLYRFLKENSQYKTLWIFLDSYGWLFREHLQSIGHQGWLSQFALQPLRVPYPPATRNSYWVIGSGSSWQERKEHAEYFADLLKEPERGLIIEADRQFYPSPLQHILHTDLNNNGSIDDEIYETAKNYLTHDLDFLLVHFHSLDDVGHATGAYSRARIETFARLENYIEELTKAWQGEVYLFSDHGMHTESNTGRHYLGNDEDMLGLWGQLK
ncbi:MAG: hypothetical protein APR54_05765 [Candidatus Cloacimonas sp. SDB]|nr:MAG: hypothetical protein APR54_05765 [Candidatus Cloacimonas sp. SDB]